MTNFKKIMVYIVLEDMESNGTSGWLDKASKHAIGCALTCAASEKGLIHR